MEPQRPSYNDAQNILEVIENQLNAIQKHDYKSAYENYTSEPLRGRISFDQFVDYVNSYSVINHNKNALFGNPEFTQHQAIMRGTLTATDGTVYKAEYHLIKEGNQWKVHGLKLTPVAPRIEAPEPSHAGADYDFQGDISH